MFSVNWNDLRKELLIYQSSRHGATLASNIHFHFLLCFALYKLLKGISDSSAAKRYIHQLVAHFVCVLYGAGQVAYSLLELLVLRAASCCCWE